MFSDIMRKIVCMSSASLVKPRDGFHFSSGTDILLHSFITVLLIDELIYTVKNSSLLIFFLGSFKFTVAFVNKQKQTFVGKLQVLHLYLWTQEFTYQPVSSRVIIFQPILICIVQTLSVLLELGKMYQQIIFKQVYILQNISKISTN